jgi:aldehyde dehydrogenase (NAD+)
MATAVLGRLIRTAPAHYDALDNLFVDGQWRAGRGDEVRDDVDPYTGDVIAQIHLANELDLDDAFFAASRVQREWAGALPRDRATVIRRAADILQERREEIVDWLIRESGSTRIKANLEVDIAYAITMESSTFPSRVEAPIVPTDISGKESRIYRRPVGVVGMISPWNFPLHLSMRSIAPALAVGNGVVLKPASDTPITGGTLLGKIFEEAGLPKGLLNVVAGAGSVIGDAFVRHPIPRVISFTGSTEVGRHIAILAAKSPIMKRVCLELGGNSPLVVLDDADMDVAVNAAIFGKFCHQGQICMAINRLIVDAMLYDEFCKRFVDRARNLKVGNPADEDTVIGPLINRQQLDNLMKHIQRGRDEGAKLVVGGEPKGLVLPPHVFVDATNGMSIAQDEMFGPVVPILKVKGQEEALKVANDTAYGLSSAVITKDLERGNCFALEVQAGMTHVNDSPVNDLPNCPFGGEKNSGLGRYNGQWAIEEFTTLHWVSIQHVPIRYPF